MYIKELMADGFVRVRASHELVRGKTAPSDLNASLVSSHGQNPTATVYTVTALSEWQKDVVRAAIDKWLGSGSIFVTFSPVSV